MTINTVYKKFNMYSMCLIFIRVFNIRTNKMYAGKENLSQKTNTVFQKNHLRSFRFVYVYNIFTIDCNVNESI